MVSRRPIPAATRGAGIAFFAALAAVACTSSTRPKIEPPEVAVESVRVLGLADARASLSVGLRLTNPNDFGLAVDAVDFQVELDGRPAVDAHSVRIDPLPAHGDAKVDLAGRVDVTAVANALMTLGTQLPVGYVLRGTARLPDGTALPFSRTGEITVARFDRALGPRP